MAEDGKARDQEYKQKNDALLHARILKQKRIQTREKAQDTGSESSLKSASTRRRFRYIHPVAERNKERLRLGIIILAAGASRRMGRPKLLLPWGKTSVLGHLLQQSGALNAQQIAVVCAAEASALLQELERLNFPQENRILNATPERGMFSSIQCAANWTGWHAEITHWLILLGDQPHLRLETLEALVDLGRRNQEKICQPMRGQRRKHPVLMPRRAFQQLRDT